MRWPWNQDPTGGKRKREDDGEGEKMNSSFQIASYARITNTRVKAGKMPHLLTLPDDTRKHIFRLALVESIPIRISANDKEVHPASGLLNVCHDIRQEALGIFYTENDFDLHVRKFDAAALQPWLKKYTGHRSKAEEQAKKDEAATGARQTSSPSSFDPGSHDRKNLSPTQTWMLEKQRIYHSSRASRVTVPRGSISWTVPFEPNWTNFVTWLKLYLSDEIQCPPEYERSSGNAAEEAAQEAALAVAYVVEALKGERWEVVQKMLPGLRKVLEAGEPRWLNEDGKKAEDEEAEDSEMTWNNAEE